MGMESEGRVWLITGASSGLGRALAQTALGRGERVAATARELESVREFERDHPGRALAVELDVTDQAAAKGAVAKTVERFDRLDAVASNAGFGLFGALEELSDDELRREFDTNVFGAVNVIRAALPEMRARRSGHIVQISSLEGVAPALAGETAYAGTKFAIEGICEALAKEVAHLGIRVTIVEPGPLRTDFADGATVEPPTAADYEESVGGALEWFEDLAGKQPNDPTRVAEAVVQVVDSPEPPLRLALGVEAIEAIRDKLDGQKAELDAWEELGATTAIPA
jgi:NAD(P)-dependent dehydrogenase (short-subunit alcohol dehydrogenase family)